MYIYVYNCVCIYIYIYMHAYIICENNSYVVDTLAWSGIVGVYHNGMT